MNLLVCKVEQVLSDESGGKEGVSLQSVHTGILCGLEWNACGSLLLV